METGATLRLFLVMRTLGGQRWLTKHPALLAELLLNPERFPLSANLRHRPSRLGLANMIF